MSEMTFQKTGSNEFFPKSLEIETSAIRKRRSHCSAGTETGMNFLADFRERTPSLIYTGSDFSENRAQ